VSSDPVPRRATYEDLLRVPDHLVAELIDGELFTSPRPASRHARATGAIDRRIGRAFDDGDGGPGGWWIVLEPELHLGAHVLVPDLAGWRRERVPEFPDVAAFDIAPDWVCEVISPSTGRLDRVKKLPKYAQEGVGHAWLVDPITHTLEVYRVHDARWLLVSTFGGDGAVRAEPFDAIELTLGALWISPTPPDPEESAAR
jgi:Uma2 family endonuclease